LGPQSEYKLVTDILVCADTSNDTFKILQRVFSI